MKLVALRIIVIIMASVLIAFSIGVVSVRWQGGDRVRTSRLQEVEILDKLRQASMTVKQGRSQGSSRLTIAHT